MSSKNKLKQEPKVINKIKEPHNICFKHLFPLLQWCVYSDLHHFLRMATKAKTEIILQNPSHLDNVVLARLKAVGMNHDLFIVASGYMLVQI